MIRRVHLQSPPCRQIWIPASLHAQCKGPTLVLCWTNLYKIWQWRTNHQTYHLHWITEELLTWPAMGPTLLLRPHSSHRNRCHGHHPAIWGVRSVHVSQCQEYNVKSLRPSSQTYMYYGLKATLVSIPSGPLHRRWLYDRGSLTWHFAILHVIRDWPYFRG